MIRLVINAPREKMLSLSLFLICFFLLVNPVMAGQVTITALGDQSYYRGEEITFSGTNTETGTTYLFLIGPNLNNNGAQLIAPGANVINQNPDTFVQADVVGDNTWSYKWGTGSLPLTAGTHTVYAVSYPRDRNNLAGVQYGTVSIIIKKPFIDAKMYQNGDEFVFTGSAEGCPSHGVQVWIIGENYAEIKTVPVADDCSFQFTIPRQTTTNLANGNYFILLQHPMQNDQWDIVRSDINPDYVRNLQIGASGGTDLFPLFGPKSLKGSEAANALVKAINDPSVDDTYTQIQFQIMEPSITIEPIGDRHVGDKFTITAQTNLAVDDEVLVQVYSSSFKPTDKGGHSSATGTVKVTKGNTGMNKISFDVDASTFKPDEYIVTESAVIQSATGNALFDILEGAAPTAKPTVVVTTVAPTTVVTQTTISQPSVTKADNAGSSDISIITNSGYLLAGILVLVIIAGVGVMYYRKQEKKTGRNHGQSIPSESAKRVCNRCGNTDDTGSRFCIVCGNSLDTNSATEIKPDIGQDSFDEDFQGKNQ